MTGPAGDGTPATEAADRALEDGRSSDFVGHRDLTHWPSAASRALVGSALHAGRWLAPHQVLALTLAIGVVLASALAALVGGIYDAVVESDGVAVLDHPALRLAVSERSPALNAVVNAYTAVGGPVGMPVLASATALALAWEWRRWTPLVLVVTTMLGSLAMTIAGKAAVGRVRPPLVDAVPPYEHSPSFPSGHSLNAVAFAGIVAYLLLRRLHRTWTRVLTVVLAAAFATTIGLSRVYLGHHWLTDVLVGWTLGLAWLCVVITAHRLFLTLRRHRAAGAAPSGGPVSAPRQVGASGAHRV